MPKIVNYTPAWLSRPSAGAKIFTDPAPQSPTSPSKRASQHDSLNGVSTAEYQGPRKLLARRGTEIFTVVGNKLRWADLSAVKRDWEAKGSSWTGGNGLELASQEQDGAGSRPYRTLAVPVYYQIRRLVISPSGVFLAICTEHTVHIAVLPDSSRLRDQDQSPLKLKTYQLGPTTHVIPGSPIASILWHPLAVATNSSDCLITVTAEAAVRVWELDRSNQWSFERPALAIDLKKLADGVSCDDDFEPSGFGKSRGFSVDEFDMEASAACFGGKGQADEDPWASMTLWTAMRNGGIYALCPLLPSKWAPSATTIPSLSTRAVSQVALSSDLDISPEEHRATSQQYEWIQEIDSEESMRMLSEPEQEELEVCRRPSNPSAIPRLQGPFELQMDGDFLDLEVSDVYVISAKLDEDELLAGEDYADFEGEGIDGLPFALLCIATTDEELFIYMDLEGVSGQWLPKGGHNTFIVPDSDTKEFVLVDVFSPSNSKSTASDTSWPMLSFDGTAPTEFFLTTSLHTYAISLADWSSRIAPELLSSDQTDSGLQTRLTAACQTQICDSGEVIAVEGQASYPRELLSAPVLFNDAELGSMLVTSTPSNVYAVSFDQEDTLLVENGTSDLDYTTRASLPLALQGTAEVAPIPRPAYQTANAFLQSSTAPLKSLLGSLPTSRQSSLKQPLRLSPATLEIMASAHRVLSRQTSHLEQATADLFRRCERMRSELTEQIKQMAELADRLQHINAEIGATRGANGNFEERVEKVQERQKKMLQRYEDLRRKTARASNVSRDLSEKEVAWASEIQDLSKTFGIENDTIAVDEDPRGISGRLEMVKQLAEDLLEESRNIEKALSAKEDSNTTESEANSFRRSSTLVNSRLQKEKINDVMAMVEREGAVIDAVMARLDRLSVVRS